MTDLAPHLSAYLGEHLPRDRTASRHTVASYAYCFELLIEFASKRLRKRPVKLQIEHLTPPLILDFLDSLEQTRGNSAQTRNLRLAAIRSFFRYLEYHAPVCLGLAQRVHAIPVKRTVRPLVDYLDEHEIEALLNAPDVSTVGGIRDQAMLYVAFTAGLRVSELIALRCGDYDRKRKEVRVFGKGRRERVQPLWTEAAATVCRWLAVRPAFPEEALFLNARGHAMSRHGVAQRLRVHAATAQRTAPSIANKRLSPHILRHSFAMQTLNATGDVRMVSLSLGHAHLTTTEFYLRNDPEEKLSALQARVPPSIEKGSFPGAPDQLMAVLRGAKRV